MVPQVRPKGIRLRTEHAAESDFIALFRDFCDDTTLFVPTDKLYPAGTSCYFSIELADEAPMLRGLGVVIASWDDDRNQFGCAGVHVEITQLTTASEGIFDKLLAARPVRSQTGRHRNAPLTQQQWGAVIEAATQEMEAVEPIEDSVEESPPPRAITRDYPSAPPPSMVAAPVAELDDRAMGTTRYDVSLRPPAPVPTPSMPEIPVPARETPTPAASRAASQALMKPWWQERRIIGVFAVGILVGLVMHAALRPPAPPSGEPATGVAVANAAATSCELVASARPTPNAAAAVPAPVASVTDVTVKKPAIAKPVAKPAAAIATKPAPLTRPAPAIAAKPAPAKPAPAIAAKPAPPKPASVIATKPAAKPAAAIATAKPAPAKPAPAIAAKPAPAKSAAIAITKPAPAAKPTAPSAKPAAIAATKPAPATKPTATAKPASATPTRPAPTKAAVARGPAKRKCTSLDCI